MEAERPPPVASLGQVTKTLLLEDSLDGSNGVLKERYQPLCFGQEAFNRPDFAVDEFISDCRRRVPLESVLHDLQEYSSSLQNELVQLINRDYASFVSLSTTLVGLDDVIGNLRMPLSQMKLKIEAVQACLDAYLLELKSRLKEKQAVAAKKECLELFVHVHESIHKIEALLHIDEKKKKEGDDTDELSDSDGQRGKGKQIAAILMKADADTSKLIQRVANDFNQLKFYVSKGGQYPFVQKMEKRIDFIENSLQKGMEHLYKEGLNTKNADIIANCLRTYSAIDRVKEAERMFRVHIVHPFMVRTVTLQKLERRKKGSTEGLEGIYQEILDWVAKECGLVLEITNTSLSEFDFLVNGVMAEVMALIEQVIPKIFWPAIPDVFYQNYTTTMKFISSMEKFAHNRTLLNSFRSNTEFTKFKKKWDINSNWYFQLRFQEIASVLEQTLKPLASSLTPPSSPNEFVLSASRTLWNCMGQCWAEGIFIPQLSHRFYKLSLQLISRYHTWLNSQLYPKEQSGSVTPEGTSPSSSPSATKPLLLAQSDMLLLHHDLELILSLMNNSYVSTVLKANADLPASVLVSVEEGVRTSMEGIAALERAMGNSICNSIAQQCVYNLQPMRNIPQMYRMTNKPTPTRFCYYVPRVLTPLENFLNDKSPYISQPNRVLWTLAVVESVTNKFYDMSTDLLETLYKMEEYLKKRSKNEAQISGEVSDTAKIVRQLCLDVEKFGSFLTTFHTDTSFPPYQRLWKYVTEAERHHHPTAIAS